MWLCGLNSGIHTFELPSPPILKGDEDDDDDNAAGSGGGCGGEYMRNIQTKQNGS